MKPKMKTDEMLAYKVSGVSIGVNLFLSAGKLLAGFLANSGAMISDAVHSASDVLSTIVVIAGIKISSKKADSDHEYGHERLECIASLILSLFLFATGLGIGWNGLQAILNSNTQSIEIPGMLALVAAVISIILKEGMFWYTRGAAKKINSGALMADAWHHRSDALSSVGAFAGILGARMGYPILDPIASLVICLFIAKAAYDIFKDATDKLVDKSCSMEIEKQMNSIIKDVDGVAQIDDLKTRLFGSKIYVDVEISANEKLSFAQAHEIAEKTQEAIEEAFPLVKRCMVHVNPLRISERLKQSEFKRDKVLSA